ncbi:MAG: endonuclease [Luteibaculaceae bacterium]
MSFSLFKYTLLIISIACANTSYGQLDYYQSAYGLQGDTLRMELYNIIKNHVQFPYTSSNQTDTWQILREADKDTLNEENVLLIYTGQSVNGAQQFNNGNGWNREHVWPVSRGSLGTSPGPGTDLHHIRAANIAMNATRENRNFDECVACVAVGFGNFRDANAYTFTPRPVIKGDIARMVLYMDLRYNGAGNEPNLTLIPENLPSNNAPNLGNINTLLTWHETDPVSNWEIDRNNIIYSYQENRNPFIDHPELTDYLWGDLQTEPWFPATLTIKETVSTNPKIKLYPNPAKDYFVLKTINRAHFTDAQYTIYNLSGQVLLEGRLEHSESVINSTKLASGVYFIRIFNSEAILHKKIIIDR